MKVKINQTKICLVAAIAVFCLGLNFSTATATAQRERISEKPTPTVSPQPKISPTPKQTPTPTPTATPAATPTPVSVQTVADLQARIRGSLFRPELKRARVGLKIVSLDTNRMIYEENAEKYFMPASNMKSFTVAAALEKLSPDFRFVTSVYAAQMPDASGLIRGDLTVYGRGDPSLSFSFYDGDYLKGLDALAQKIQAAGVKRIEGNLIGDESYFTGSAIPYGWEWDDLQWNSGAEPSALTVNNNVVNLSVKPNSTVGAPCAVQITPANSVVRVVNRCATTASGARRDLQIFKRLDTNTIEISGALARDDKGFENVVTVSHPAEIFLALLRQILIQKGIVITGQNRVIGAKDKAVTVVASSVIAASPSTSPPAQIEIARLESPPLALIAAKTMKPSQNLYTENILRALGERMKITATLSTIISPTDNPLLNANAESYERGLFVVQDFLRGIGVAPDAVLQYDGSGLSRHNLITPAAAVSLYTFMSRSSRFANAWRDSLPIGGVDGTLKSRLTGTAAAGNARAKTGTIDQVSSLSGYVMTAAGEHLVFSIIVNDAADGRLRQSVIDEIVVALANFNGKT